METETEKGHPGCLELRWCWLKVAAAASRFALNAVGPSRQLNKEGFRYRQDQW